MQPRIIFITGTDTGVGKTVLTGLLLSHLRQTGARALAIKPFCSGGRADAELLHDLQGRELTLDQINPFHFREPLAPLAAARLHRQRIGLDQVVRSIRKIQRLLTASSDKLSAPALQNSSTQILLVEGAGGLLAPLGENFDATDLITALKCRVIVVAANRLGAINHSLLTIRELKHHRIRNVVLVLNNLLSARNAEVATRHNASLIRQLVKPVPLIQLPFLGKCRTAAEIRGRAAKLRKSLCKIYRPFLA